MPGKNRSAKKLEKADRLMTKAQDMWGQAEALKAGIEQQFQNTGIYNSRDELKVNMLYNQSAALGEKAKNLKKKFDPNYMPEGKMGMAFDPMNLKSSNFKKQ